MSPLDTGFTVGAGVFETLLALDGEPCAFGRHYARLVRSAAVFGLKLPPADELRTACRSVAVASTHPRARLRITVTCGPGLPGATLPGGPPTLMVVAVEAAVPTVPANLITVPWRRNPESAIHGIKSISYAENLLAFAAAKAAGADEAVILNTRGEVCEGATSNLWYVLDGCLHTPGLDGGCLPGVTRGMVLELCAESGVAVDHSPQGGAAMAAAEAVFLTSSIRGVHPAASCDGRSLDSATHPLVTMLARALDAGRAGRRWDD